MVAYSISSHFQSAVETATDPNAENAYRTACAALLSRYPNCIILNVQYIFLTATTEYVCILTAYANDATLANGSLRIYSSTVRK